MSFFVVWSGFTFFVFLKAICSLFLLTCRVSCDEKTETLCASCVMAAQIPTQELAVCSQSPAAMVVWTTAGEKAEGERPRDNIGRSIHLLLATTFGLLVPPG